MHSITLSHSLSQFAACLLTHGQVLYPVAAPIAPAGKHIILLRGSLAPESAVVKLSGKELDHFTGPAVVFDSEAEAFQGVMTNKVSHRPGAGITFSRVEECAPLSVHSV